jgi:hypothetical protein
MLVTAGTQGNEEGIAFGNLMGWLNEGYFLGGSFSNQTDLNGSDSTCSLEKIAEF